MRPRLLKEPDPFALDATSEGFFAVGDTPTPRIEKIELELEEEDTEFARRSAPEVVMRRRRYRRLVTRAVSGVGVIAMAAFAKGALRPADASALRQPSQPAQFSQQIEPTPAPEVVSVSPPPEELAVLAEPAPTVEPTPVAKVTRRAAAKRDDDFSDLDIKIEVPRIDTSLDLSP